jgi:hypothetical protein
MVYVDHSYRCISRITVPYCTPHWMTLNQIKAINLILMSNAHHLPQKSGNEQPHCCPWCLFLISLVAPNFQKRMSRSMLSSFPVLATAEALSTKARCPIDNSSHSSPCCYWLPCTVAGPEQWPLWWKKQVVYQNIINNNKCALLMHPIVGIITSNEIMSLSIMHPVRPVWTIAVLSWWRVSAIWPPICALVWNFHLRRSCWIGYIPCEFWRIPSKFDWTTDFVNMTILPDHEPLLVDISAHCPNNHHKNVHSIPLVALLDWSTLLQGGTVILWQYGFFCLKIHYLSYYKGIQDYLLPVLPTRKATPNMWPDASSHYGWCRYISCSQSCTRTDATNHGVINSAT